MMWHHIIIKSVFGTIALPPPASVRNWSAPPPHSIFTFRHYFPSTKKVLAVADADYVAIMHQKYQ
jgi:hypothetical protein